MNKAIFAYVLPEYVTTLDAEAVTAPAPTAGDNWSVIISPNWERLAGQLVIAGISVKYA